MIRNMTSVAVGLAVLPAAAHHDVAKDLMPKGMVIGVAINQRQLEGESRGCGIAGVSRSRLSAQSSRH
jgi:hypothetical protein